MSERIALNIAEINEANRRTYTDRLPEQDVEVRKWILSYLFPNPDRYLEMLMYQPKTVEKEVLRIEDYLLGGKFSVQNLLIK